MQHLEQKQQEAVLYMENRIKFWGAIEKSGSLPSKTKLSKKDKKWLAEGPAEGEGLKALATRKLKVLNKCLANTKRKLGKD